MSDPSSQSKLEALGDILGVDDTEELVRPERVRGIGEILGHQTDDGDPDVETGELPGEAASSDPADTTPPAEPPRKRKAPVRAPASPDVGVPKRTSAMLPAEFVLRLRTALSRRWDFGQLVVSALDHQELGEEAADMTLASFDGSIRSVRSFTLPESVMDRLDKVGERWRMNRSQTLTVLLDRELGRLGF